MGRHTQQSDHKVAHTILLTLSILSVGSPVGLIMAVSEQKDVAEAEPTIDSLDTSWLALPQGSPTLNLSIPIEKARQETVRRVTKKPRPPTATATKAKAKAKVKAEAETSLKPKTPTSRPVPTVTSHTTTRPSVAQRQIAKANTTTNHRPPTTPPPPRRSTSTTSHRPTSTATQKSTTNTQKPTTTTSPRTTTTAATTTTTATKEPPPPSSSVGERVVAVAKTYVGDNLPYRMGGDSLTTGIDCSHFVWRVFKEAGLSVPYRSSSALAVWTKRVTTPQIGDLVLYSGHVGIYAGNGMMVHHGKPGGAFFIKVYKDNFIGYGRIPA